MAYNFGPDSIYLSSGDQFAFHGDKGSVVAKPSNDVPDYLYDFDINGPCSALSRSVRSCLTHLARRFYAGRTILRCIF